MSARSTARRRGSPMGTDAALPPYHLGFVSLDRETEIDSLPARGDVPAWLNGTLLRTGPCKFEVGDRSYNHWFDGLAMLHRFTFADGQVSYANRFVRGHTFCEAERRGRISYAEFATDPCRTLFGKIAARSSPLGSPTTATSTSANLPARWWLSRNRRCRSGSIPQPWKHWVCTATAIKSRGRFPPPTPTATPRASATITICCSLGGRAPIACSASIRNPADKRSSPSWPLIAPRICTASG